MKNSKILLSVISIAISFTLFACSGDNSSNPDDGNSSSIDSNGGESSSSLSSSSIDNIGGESSSSFSSSSIDSSSGESSSNLGSSSSIDNIGGESSSSVASSSSSNAVLSSSSRTPSSSSSVKTCISPAIPPPSDLTEKPLCRIPDSDIVEVHCVNGIVSRETCTCVGIIEQYTTTGDWPYPPEPVMQKLVDGSWYEKWNSGNYGEKWNTTGYWSNNVSWSSIRAVTDVDPPYMIRTEHTTRNCEEFDEKIKALGY